MRSPITAAIALDGLPAIAQFPLCAARLAVYAVPLEPPLIHDVELDDPAEIIEDLYSRAADAASIPSLAVREVIENLVHARFRGALVSVLDGGCTVRVSDAGPGIPDKPLALQPGFSTADDDARAVIRGVGSGLPLAAELLRRRGGVLELADNLAGGTVVTLRVAAEEREPVAVGPSDLHRRILALLLELQPAVPQVLARELGVPLGVCGRELALLEHRGMVERAPDGARTLTDSGTALVATLF